MFTVHTELALTPYRNAFEQMALGAIVVPNCMSEPHTSEIRARVAKRSFMPYRLVHQGHFAHADAIDEPELTQGLVELAEFITQTRLAVVWERCFRLTRGDYVLSQLHGGEVGFHEGGRLIDAIVDLSASSSGEAQVVYAHKGEHFFAAPQLSRSMSLIERRTSVTRYHRYLNHLMQGRTVYRYCVTLARTDVAPTDPPSRRP